jgi:hypothetical protein
MLSAPNLPPGLHAKILEYVTEKMVGLYGDTKRELKRFMLRLSLTILNEARAYDPNRVKRFKSQTSVP